MNENVLQAALPPPTETKGAMAPKEYWLYEKSEWDAQETGPSELISDTQQFALSARPRGNVLVMSLPRGLLCSH